LSAGAPDRLKAKHRDQPLASSTTKKENGWPCPLLSFYFLLLCKAAKKATRIHMHQCMGSSFLSAKQKAATDMLALRFIKLQMEGMEW